MRRVALLLCPLFLSAVLAGCSESSSIAEGTPKDIPATPPGPPGGDSKDMQKLTKATVKPPGPPGPPK